MSSSLSGIKDYLNPSSPYLTPVHYKEIDLGVRLAYLEANDSIKAAKAEAKAEAKAAAKADKREAEEAARREAAKRAKKAAEKENRPSRSPYADPPPRLTFDGYAKIVQQKEEKTNSPKPTNEDAQRALDARRKKYLATFPPRQPSTEPQSAPVDRGEEVLREARKRVAQLQMEIQPYKRKEKKPPIVTRSRPLPNNVPLGLLPTKKWTTYQTEAERKTRPHNLLPGTGTGRI